jgi:hypothetical protein
MVNRRSWHVAVFAGLTGTILGLILSNRHTPPTPIATAAKDDAVLSPRQTNSAAVSSSALEPLTGENLKQRTSEIFSACYFTSIAIIQGAALALLMASALPFHFGHQPEIQRAAFLGRGLMGLVSIITVSYEYLWFTIVVRWAPTFLDTLVPYLLGVGEIAPLILLRQATQWWLAMGFFLPTAILAFSHTLMRSSRHMFSKKPDLVYPMLRRLLLQLIGVCLAILAVVITGLVLSVTHTSAEYPLGVMPWLLACIGISMVTVTERGLNAVYDAYEVPRRWNLRHRPQAKS